MTRSPAFAGTFYAGNPVELENQITESFEHKLGPGALPVNKREGSLKAVIAPHAGYAYSGPCAAWSYKAIAEADFPDLYVLLAPNHHGTGTALSLENWETPLGMVRIDQGFAKAFMEKSGIKADETVHAREHAIEVQLPFLQFVTKDHMHELKILPVLLDQDADLKKLALDLKETILETKKQVVFIASSDFTHYGSNYRYVPFTLDVKKNIYALDEGAINLIKKADAKGLLAYAEEHLTTICGILPIALLLETIKPNSVELEQYYTSADITDGNYKNSVSYGSIIFR